MHLLVGYVLSWLLSRLVRDEPVAHLIRVRKLLDSDLALMPLSDDERLDLESIQAALGQQPCGCEPAYQITVAESGGLLVGYAIAEIYRDRIECETLRVFPGFETWGADSCLLTVMADNLAPRCPDLVLTWPRDDVAAIDRLRLLGFKPRGLARDREAFVMRLRMTFGEPAASIDELTSDFE